MPKAVPGDWQKTFGHPLILLETSVDPQQFEGTVSKAANWSYSGHTKGFRRTAQGYSSAAPSPKMVFVKPLRANARALLSRSILDQPYRIGAPKFMLTAEQMRLLPDFFIDITDPRRAQGRRHPLAAVMAIAAGASVSVAVVRTVAALFRAIM